jgi:hypothetical protein
VIEIKLTNEEDRDRIREIKELLNKASKN